MCAAQKEQKEERERVAEKEVVLLPLTPSKAFCFLVQWI